MKIIHILSGGMDSTTLLYDLVSQGHQVECLSFNYGQRHSKELRMAKKTCQKLKVPHKIVNIKSIKELLQGSSLTSKDTEVPKGYYEDRTMRQTVVPNRNMIMLSLAIGYAVSKNFDAVSYAAHGGDHAIYPDCRPLFVKKMNELSLIANYQPVRVIAPYLKLDKASILRRGLELGVNYSLTWTCYCGEKLACGKCGACRERLEAFEKNKRKDPVKYGTTVGKIDKPTFSPKSQRNSLVED